MNLKKYIPTAVTRATGRTVLKMQKNSPHILFVAGVAGVVGGTVLACRATLKLNNALDEIQKDIHNVKELNNAHGTENYQKDLAYVYGKSTVKILRLYGPAVLVGGFGIFALTASHQQMTARNNALMAAYAALEKAHNEYRDRIKKEVGEEREKELWLDVHNVTEAEFEKLAVDPNKLSPHARFFDQFCGPWKPDPEANRIFLQCQQNYYNHILNSRGHVFLNEIYDSLGMERSAYGAVVGWLRGGEGDNFIDFGMFDVYNSRFINNAEPSILLDFNVQGIIYNKI